MRRDIAELRRLTQRPFGVNLFAPPGPAGDPGADVFRQLGLIPKAGGRQERAMQAIHRVGMRVRGR